MRSVAAVACLTFAFAPLAAAQVCDNKEYAQLKDEAKTQFGRVSLAQDHCRLAKLGACRQDQTKIADALVAAKDPKVVDWMLKGCAGEAPTVAKSKQKTAP